MRRRGAVDGQALAVAEECLRRKRGDFSGQLFGRDGVDDRRLPRPGGGRRGAIATRRLRRGSFAEDVGAHSQEGGELLVGVERLHLPGSDRLADLDAELAVRLVDELARQQQRAQPRVDKAGEVEERAVAAPEEYRDDGGARLARHPGDRRTPDIVAHEAGAQVDAGDLARREGREDMALL